MHKVLLALTIAFAGGASVAASEWLVPDGSTAIRCLADTAGYSKSVLGKVRKTVSDDRLEPVRVAMGLPHLPVDSAVLVTDPQVCEKAARAVAEYKGLDATVMELVLIRIGDRYWAEDGKVLGGEWPLVFLLDSSATRVLAQH